MRSQQYGRLKSCYHVFKRSKTSWKRCGKLDLSVTYLILSCYIEAISDHVTLCGFGGAVVKASAFLITSEFVGSILAMD